MPTGTTRCPAQSRYAFNNGTHCCTHGVKSSDSSVHEQCNGEAIAYSTTLECCQFGQYVACPGVLCSDMPKGEKIFKVV